MVHRITMSVTVARTCGCLIFACLCLFQWRCVWESGAGPENISSSTLEIVATTPPNGASGPFDLYTPSKNNRTAHFYICFNKTMDLSSITPQAIQCSGFDQPVNVIVYSDYINNYELVGFRIIGKNRNPHIQIPMTYQVNRKYTITIDSSIEDSHGRPLGHIKTFSFTPEPYFRIIDLNINNGDTIIPANVEVCFNSKVTPGILGAISIDPAIPNDWRVMNETDSTSILLDAFGMTIPSHYYTVTIGSNATDEFGNCLHNTITRTLYTPPLAISCTPSHGSNNVSLAATVVFTFNYPMDILSEREAFSIDPPTTVDVYAGQNQFSLTGITDFIQNTNYKLRFSTQLKTQSGCFLASPIQVDYHTASFQMTHTPADQDSGVSVRTVIDLAFTGALKTTTVPGAITISPSMKYHLTYDEDNPGKFNHVYIVPNAPLANNTTFIVTVSNAIQSIGGYRLPAPVVFGFTTESQE